MTHDLTQLIERLEALAAKATEGPWTECRTVSHGESSYEVSDGEDYIVASMEEGDDPAADAAFIAASRTAIPTLTAALREQAAEIERLERENALHIECMEGNRCEANEQYARAESLRAALTEIAYDEHLEPGWRERVARKALEAS